MSVTECGGFVWGRMWRAMFWGQMWGLRLVAAVAGCDWGGFGGRVWGVQEGRRHY